MANSSRLCLICGQVLGSDAERRDHLSAEHPGQKVAWRNKLPYVVGPDGTETRIGPAALKRMRGNARRVTGGRAAARGRTVVHRPAPTPSPAAPVMVEQPLPDDPEAPAYFVQAQPFHITAAAGIVPPAGESPTAPAPDPAAIAAVSRESIKLALGVPTLAGMIRNLSIVVSDWDGAGERGYLSQIESSQIAMLVQDPAIAAVQRYFGGDVGRFKLALAAGILLLGKGRIHAQAIIAKRRAAELAAQAPEPEASYAATQPAEPVAAPAPEASGEPDPIAALAARQREWHTTPRGEAA